MDPKVPEFRPVPFFQEFTKLDLKAIYRRPRRELGPFDETIQSLDENGMPAWDLVTGLPMLRHSDWLAKGFEYVTLADADSLQKAAPILIAHQLRPSDFIQHPHFGAWNPKLYQHVSGVIDQENLAAIVAQVRQFGVDAFEGITGKKVPPAALRMMELQNAKAAGGDSAPVASTMTTETTASGSVTSAVATSAAPAAKAKRSSKPRSARKSAAATPATS